MFVADVKCSQATWQTVPNTQGLHPARFAIYGSCSMLVHRCVWRWRL